MNEDKYFTDLDIKIQQLAAIDWVQFCTMIGPEGILSAKICLLHSQGNSLQQIANRLEISKQTARYWVEKQPGRKLCKRK